MSNVTFLLNGKEASASVGSTILEAARQNGAEIPTLCYLEGINKIGACRMCLVEVKGLRVPQAACITPVREGMEIETESDTVRNSRKMNLELIAQNHHLDCEYCPNYQDCELHALFVQYGVDTRKYGDFARKPEYDETAVHIGRDASRCILCRRCVSACAKQGVRAIGVLGRGASSKAAAYGGLGSSACVGCGQCAAVCPTGSIFIKDDTNRVWVTINQGKKPVIAVLAPDVGKAVGKKFHEAPGQDFTGKLIAFLHKVGVKKVYSVNDADTASAKGEDILRKKAEGKVALSGDCPAFVKYVENFWPDLRENLTAAPSPETETARLARKAYAIESGADPKDITVISISSCTAQKMERLRPENEGVIDAALTTVEIYNMLHHACLSRYTTLDVWRGLSPEPFDLIDPEGGKSPSYIPDAVPGCLSGEVSECTSVICGEEVAVKTVSGLGNAKELLESVRNKEAGCDYISVRACPGGCINGGGQPK